jgi:ribosomal protein S27E
MLPSPAGREASSGGGAPPYVRHRPERTLLYQLVEEYYPAFKAHLAAQGTDLPGYVQQEFEDYLKCGRLEHGFLRVRCDTCHAEHLVAFSCKKRGFCPSCGARRMAESAALLVDEVFPEQPVRQWVLSVPYPLRFLFASRPEVMGRVLGIVYRCIATHLIKKAGFSRKTAQAGAVTLIQRFGSALNLNVHFHMLFLDGVYVVERPDGSLRFPLGEGPEQRRADPTGADLARRIGRFLERQGLLERDAENSYLAGDGLEAGPMEQLIGSLDHLSNCRRPQQGRKVFTLQTLPACDEPFDDGVGKVAGFSLHAGVAARADQRQKLERLCRYISRPAGHLGKAPVAHAERQRSLPAEDAVPRRHDACHLRAARLHCPAGSPGAETAGQPDALPRGICAQQQTPRAGDTGQAGQGRPACHDSGPGGADTGRTPCRDDLGAAPQAGVRDRHRDLPGLRRGGADHRVHRGSRRHREDPHPPGCESAGARSHPAASLPGATAAGAVRRDGVTTPGRPRLGFAVSGMAMAAAGRETGGEGESAPAPLSLG